MAFLAVRCLTAVMGVAVLVVMSRSLSRSEFGVFALALSLTQIGSTISDSGLNGLLAREAIANPEVERSLLRWAAAIRFVTGLVAALVLLGVGIALIRTRDELLPLGLVLATLPVLGFTVVQAAMGRRLQLGRVAALTLAQSGLWLAAVLYLGSQKSDLLAFCVAYLGSTLIYGLLTVFAGRGILRQKGIALPFSEARSLLRQALPLGITGALVIAYAKLDGVLLFWLKGSDVSAAYSLSYRVLDQLGVLPLTIATVFSPLMVHAMKADEGAADIFARWTRLSLVASVPVALIVVAAARTLVFRVFGGTYADSIGLLQVLAPSFVLICLGWVLTGAAVATRQARAQLLVAASCLVLNVTLNIVFIPLYGAKAAALATLATELCVVVGLYLAIRRSAALPLPPASVWRKLTAAGLGFAACVLLLPGPAGIAVGTAAYLAVALYLGLVTKQDLIVRRPDAEAIPVPAAAT